MKNVLLILPFLFIFSCKTSKVTEADTFNEVEISHTLDSVLQIKTLRPFHGEVLVSQNGKLIYQKYLGDFDQEKKMKIDENSEFYIGSLSKQITAALVLQQVDLQKIALDKPISTYLPHLKMSWKDSVSVRNLLNHTHGMDALDKPLNFKPNSSFKYGSLGYQLLSEILENVTHKPFKTLVNQLFKELNMTHSSFPESNNPNLAKGYRREAGELKIVESKNLEGIPVAAGRMISNVKDLEIWNENLYSGNIISTTLLKEMTTKSATQNHSLFGEVGYGYGLRINPISENVLEFGHTGYLDGYISSNFYYPNTQTSLIIIENLDWNDDDIKKTFNYQLMLREVIVNLLKKEEK